MVATRQNLPTYDKTVKAAPKLICIASGSEVEQSVSAYEELTAQGIKVLVVSMPCVEVFDEQTAEYKESVLPAGPLFKEFGFTVENAIVTGLNVQEK